MSRGEMDWHRRRDDRAQVAAINRHKGALSTWMLFRVAFSNVRSRLLHQSRRGGDGKVETRRDAALVMRLFFVALLVCHGCLALAASAAPSTGSQGRPPTPVSRGVLVRREPLQASGTLTQEPPFPPGWISGSVQPTSTSQDRRGGGGVRPTDVRGPGRGPPPRNMDPRPPPRPPDATRDPRAIHTIVAVPIGPPGAQQTHSTQARFGSIEGPADPFSDIWSPTNLPQPGDSIIRDPPPAPTPSPPRSPSPPPSPDPTAPLFGLPRQPAPTPTFSAIPIVPIGVSARTNASSPNSPPLPAPPHHMQPGVCENGWCTLDESCSTCPFDCSLAHGDYVQHRRALAWRQWLLGDRGLDAKDRPKPTHYTFECGLAHVAQFCPRSPSGKPLAMIAVTGRHPSEFTPHLPNALKDVPATAVMVFLDLPTLVSLQPDAAAAVHMRRVIRSLAVDHKYALGIALGSIVHEMVDGLSPSALSLAARVHWALPRWVWLNDQEDPRSLITYVRESATPSTPLSEGARPLYISLDPGSAYRAAVTNPTLPKLLAAFNARLVVPSLPLNDAQLPQRAMSPADDAAALAVREIQARPGISGWIVGMDAVTPNESDHVLPKVIQELAAHVAWAGSVDECLAFDPRANATRAATASLRLDVHNLVNSIPPELAVPIGWAVDSADFGGEVSAVSEDDSHLPGGVFGG